jgi:predicted O-methyltransferase YrrM
VIAKVRPGGFILADNVLWSGQVLDKETTDQQTRGIIDFNNMIKNEAGVQFIIMPIRDGLMLIQKKE